MKKYVSIYLYGAIAIFTGAFLLFSDSSSFNTLKLTVGISLTIGAIFSFFSAFSSRRNQIEFAYHEMHALAMMVYGVSVLFFCNTVEALISITSFLFIFYAASEVIFCIRLFDLKSKINFKIVIVRLLLGLAIGVGSVMAIHYSNFTLQGFGLLFIIVGVNIMLYTPVLKRNQLKDISE
jgi:uncharacterized membrane protein HdeD (DUF308 family)